MNEMGKRISQKRKEKGLTMEELASMLGVQASAINKYEKGMVENIKRTTIQKMADIFDCNPVWLMGFDAPELSNYKIETYKMENSIVDEIREEMNKMDENKLVTLLAFLKTINGGDQNGNSKEN